VEPQANLLARRRAGKTTLWLARRSRIRLDMLAGLRRSLARIVPVPALPPDAHIGEVCLTVSDLERSIAFYTDVLGCTEHERAPGRSALGARDGRVLIRLADDKHARPRLRRSSGLFHFAILVPDRAALGRSLRRLAERRWPLTGASDHLVSEALYLDDPDGLGIEIYRDRPRAEWTRDAGDVVMATDPLDLDDVAREPGAGGPWSGLDAGTIVGHVHLHVPDLDEAERLYCGEVGFATTSRRYPGALFVAAGDYHHHLGLNVWAGRGAPPPEPGTVGLDSFTIEAGGLPPRQLLDDTTRVRVTCRPAG
jgi:catechol 2,3-dioxygenase